MKIIAFFMSFLTVVINLLGLTFCMDEGFDDVSFKDDVSAVFSVSREDFSCQRGELEIKGTVFMPEGKSDCPIAIVSHGFMANQMLSHIHGQNLAKMGYAAFCFDFCGGTLIGASEGKSTEMSVLTEVVDLKAVIEFAKACEYTDSEKLVLVGCSQGGFVSALTAAQLQHQVDAIILLYPALCIPDDARSGQMMFAKFDPANVPEAFYCGPMKLGDVYVNDVIEMDPYELIGTYNGKVLIIHGTKDNIVDISYATRAVEVYENAGAAVELKIIDGGGHMFANPIHAYKALGYIRQFIATV